MKAAACRRYGSPDVLKIEELNEPVPKANEVLVKVHASTVTSGDVRLRGSRGAGIFWLPMRLVFGLWRLRNPILGMEFAGQIAAVGSDVNEFAIDDLVFGMKLGGANAEFVTVPETATIALKPDALSFEQAAAVPFGALSALTYLRKFAMLRAGQKILINGASGSVGVFAVQLASIMGAHVTAVCSTRNIELVQSLGADRVIDYLTTDFTKDGSQYDVIFDTVGNTSFFRCRRIMTEYGRHVFLVHQLPQIILALGTALTHGKRVICGINIRESRSDLMQIKDLIEAGRIRPVIDVTYPLEKIIDAHHYVDTGRKRGAVVVAVIASS
jgi:NADPH:quinone reductase-like Zn-dependent oxidoreductase